MGLAPCPYLTVPLENKERLFANLVVTPGAGATRLQVEERNAPLICLSPRHSTATSELLQQDSWRDSDDREIAWMECSLGIDVRCERKQREESVRQFHSGA